MKYTISLLCFLFTISCPALLAQKNKKLDSLLTILNNKKNREDSVRVNLLNNIAYRLTRRDPKKARFYSNKALDIAKKVNFPKGIASGNHTIGLSYYRSGDYENAIKYFLESAKTYEKLGEEESLGTPLNTLGSAFWYLKNYEKSREYYNKALKIALKFDKKGPTIRLYNNIGATYSLQNKFAKAREYYENALKGYTELGKQNKVSVALTNIGDTYEQEESYQKALEFYARSLVIDRKLQKDLGGMSITLRSIGSVNIKLKNYKEAEKALEEALQLTQKVGAKGEEKDTYSVYAQLYEATGEASKALKYYKRHDALKDSLFNIRKSKQIAEMETKYQTEKKEKELALQAKSLVQKDKEIIGQRNILIVMLLLITVAFFIVSRQRLRNRKNKEIFKTQEELIQAELKNAEQDLKFKNKELTTYALHIIQKNNILTELKDSIEEAVDDMSDQESKRLTKLIHLINYSFNLDRDWKDFKMAFEQVHEGFFEKLQQRYPNISPSEIRLCALLRLNFASKEIAAIMGISPDSVKVARYRLRKKLELSRNDSLVDFIRNM